MGNRPPDKRLSPDQWLDKYIHIRRNAGTGSEYETKILKQLNLEKNPRIFPPDNPTFIPDGVRNTDPPQFVEIKNYEKTVLRPNTNAGEQLHYLIDWCTKYPARCDDDAAPETRPSFELHISNDQNVHKDFTRPHC